MAITGANDMAGWEGRYIDPAKNCYRWYHVWVQPDLFGVWSAWTAWGRLGSPRYRQRLYPADGPLDAIQVAERIIARKLRRGYR